MFATPRCLLLGHIMQWSASQDKAIMAVKNWLQSPSEFFYLGGFAGTGKSSIARELANTVSTVSYAAFTGKAASVMAKKGCEGATTIHRLIYCPSPKSESRLKELHENLDSTKRTLLERGLTPEQVENHADVNALVIEINAEQKSLKRPRWKLNPDSEVRKSDLIVIDECSMVNPLMGEDLLSFGIPILVLGDPGQLPPVMGEGFFTRGKPDILLTEIHRQAEHNPILRLAHHVREGKALQVGEYGESKVINKANINKQDILDSDQIIVGKNDTRRFCNRRVRELRSITSPLPIQGDRTICLRNNHDIGILNGTIWNVDSCIEDDKLELELTSEDGNATALTAHKEYFLGGEPKFYEIKEAECFDYGYAITCHKSQGSEWDNVYIFDQGGVFRENANRWRYTALTRAAKKVTVVLGV